MKLSDFTYIKKTRTLVGEASELGNFKSPIEVLSEKTGKTVKFFFEGRETDAEGELVSWKFKTICEANCKMVIFND